jgi:hypothetical protein
MQPSSDRPDEDLGGGSALRRYGPVAAIVAVIAVVAALAVGGGGGDDEPADTATGSTEGTGAPEGDPAADDGPGGAVSWTEAQEQDLDVTFPDTCDPETGRVAIPYYFAAECFADVDHNGGATHRGVTEDSIVVVYYSAPETDPVLDFITGPIANDDTRAQVEETVAGYLELFGSYYQTYGRTVDLRIVQASGTSTDEVAARADAQRAIEEHQPFAAIGGPVLTNAWADEMAAAGVVCISCGSTGNEQYREARAPYLISIGMAGNQTNVHAAEWVSKKLAGKPAEHGGDAVAGAERVFGHVYLTSSEESEQLAQQLAAELSEAGVELAEQLSYQLDPGRLPEQATSIISKLKESGVTTVLLQADPVAPATFTQEATAQEYFPEWAVVGGTLVDTNTFGRVFDQQQWQHAFGITGNAVPLEPSTTPGFALYEWFHGEPPPADETSPVLFPSPSLFFSLVQAAGPDLTPETVNDALFAYSPTQRAITQPSLSWGDHGLWPDQETEFDWSGVDDKAEWWWDAQATGPDEIQREGQGMMRFVDGGRRYLPGEWDDSTTFFDPAGTVMLFEEPPEEEAPPQYPSPAG